MACNFQGHGFICIRNVAKGRSIPYSPTGARSKHPPVWSDHNDPLITVVGRVVGRGGVGMQTRQRYLRMLVNNANAELLASAEPVGATGYQHASMNAICSATSTYAPAVERESKG